MCSSSLTFRGKWIFFCFVLIRLQLFIGRQYLIAFYDSKFSICTENSIYETNQPDGKCEKWRCERTRHNVLAVM